MNATDPAAVTDSTVNRNHRNRQRVAELQARRVATGSTGDRDEEGHGSAAQSPATTKVKREGEVALPGARTLCPAAPPSTSFWDSAEVLAAVTALESIQVSECFGLFVRGVSFGCDI